MSDSIIYSLPGEESSMKEEKMRYYSLILALACVIVFLIQSYSSSFTGAFVLESSDVIARPWILITSIFLHGSLSHLIFNMFALVLFGLLLEKFVGSKRFLIVFFVSGIFASIASAFVYSSSLGASGAIYGIIGALAVIRPKMIVWTYGVPMPMAAAGAFYLLLDLLGLFFPSNVANAAHIAGLVVGVVIGLMIRKPEPKKERSEKILTKEELDQWEDEWM